MDSSFRRRTNEELKAWTEPVLFICISPDKLSVDEEEAEL